MKIQQLKSAINRCVALNIPFAVYAYAGNEEYHFICSHPDDVTGENILHNKSAGSRYFEISMFNHENLYPIGITSHLSVEDVMTLPSGYRYDDPDISPLMRSTSQILHHAQVHEIVKEIKRRRYGKVVLSRLICAITNGITVAEIAAEYFAELPDTFRFLYFTQETGLWMGATPELLLEIDYNTNYVEVMSLAGTRKISDEPWDQKNIEEHEYVTRFIAQNLRQLGLQDIKISEDSNKRFHNIEHLCTTIGGYYNRDPHELLATLSPTPAVAGYPREEALATIYNYEIHQRSCYGGYIAVNEPAEGKLRAFVNLRSTLMKVDDNNTIYYDIFAGGGITNKSIPLDEWEETQAKAAPLLSIIEKNGKTI